MTSPPKSEHGYEFKEIIGEGAYGSVYRAYQPSVDREVAIKVILPQFGNHLDFLKRLESEAQIIAKLEHLHIIPLYDYWKSEDGVFLVLRLMRGGSLEGSLKNTTWGIKETSRMIAQIGSALSAAHKKKVVHRDLKPANILLDEENNAYLSDFGIAKDLEGLENLTQTGSIMGTPAYLSPEQLQDEEILPQTDIYSLGLILFEMLSGEQAFEGDSIASLMMKQINEPVPSLAEFNPKYAEALDPIIQMATAKNALERFTTVELFLDAFRNAAGLTSRTTSINGAKIHLPVPSTPFIGRESQINEAQQQLSKSKMLTLVGPGGTGKTRLGLELASRIAPTYEDGVYFIPLAPLRESDLVPDSIAKVLGIKESSEKSILESVQDFLTDKNILLFLDNFEHLIEAAPNISQILDAAPQVCILVTSREGLRVSGEQIYTVPSLNLPDLKKSQGLDEIKSKEAVELFVQRAKTAKPDFELSEKNAAAVAEICVRLDGLPLAIELAAARVRLFSPSKLLERLDNRFSVLTGGMRDKANRQQTLRDTIDWSYDLLEDEEKVLFARLGVFNSGRSLEAVEEICSEGLKMDVFNLLESLSNKNLIYIEEGLNEQVRFIMLESIQQYAMDRLEESGETDIVLQKHFDFFLDLTQQADEHFFGHEQLAWYQIIEVELENIRNDLNWLNEQTNKSGSILDMVIALGQFWRTRSYFSEGQEWFKIALLKNKNIIKSNKYAKALQLAGSIAYRQNDLKAAEDYYEQSLGIFRNLKDSDGIAFALEGLANLYQEYGEFEKSSAYFEEALDQIKGSNRFLEMDIHIGWGWSALRTGNNPGAVDHLETALAISREIGDISGAAYVLSGLGEVSLRENDLTQAVEYLEESLDLRRELGDRWGQAVCLGSLGWAALRQEDHTRALNILGESLHIRYEIGDKGGSAWCLEKLAEVNIALEEVEKAITLYGAASALRASIGSHIDEVDQDAYNARLAAAKEGLGNDTYQTAWEKGQALSLKEVMPLAIENDN